MGLVTLISGVGIPPIAPALFFSLQPVSNAEAALSTARTNLGYCYVRAPFDGTISKATVDVGSYVGGSLQPVTLATIYKDNQMYAYFNVADNQWLTMAMDNQQLPANLPQKIMVQLGKEGTETYPAALDYLSPNVDLASP